MAASRLAFSNAFILRSESTTRFSESTYLVTSSRMTMPPMKRPSFMTGMARMDW